MLRTAWHLARRPGGLKLELVLNVEAIEGMGDSDDDDDPQELVKGVQARDCDCEGWERGERSRSGVAGTKSL